MLQPPTPAWQVRTRSLVPTYLPRYPPTVSTQLSVGARVSCLRWLTDGSTSQDGKGRREQKEGTRNSAPPYLPAYGWRRVSIRPLPQVLVRSIVLLTFFSSSPSTSLGEKKGAHYHHRNRPRSHHRDHPSVHIQLWRLEEEEEEEEEIQVSLFDATRRTADPPLLSSTVADIDMVVIHVSPQQQQLRLNSFVTNMTTFWLPVPGAWDH